ncbi:HAD hydrolase-like protein [Bradyrhizobium sp. HKCCYLS2038]|uniref:HAD hydrolase-like protein n=1 Tax=unclassified Bradyrhizobium TaxID=2631580 RepID=UPI003EB695B5
MPYSLVIFDLDGTLSDSFPWFRLHVNAVAERFGFRQVKDEDVDGLRHASTREILDFLAVPRWKLPFIARHVRKLKTAHAASIPLFDGVESMLDTLAAHGIRLALVSSDSEANARQKLGSRAGLFADYDCSASVFGKARKFRRVVRRARVAPGAVIAIGDETRDIEAARAAGIAFGAVTWGYAAEKALRAHQPELVFTQVAHIAEQLLAAPKQDR